MTPGWQRWWLLRRNRMTGGRGLQHLLLGGKQGTKIARLHPGDPHPSVAWAKKSGYRVADRRTQPLDEVRAPLLDHDRQPGVSLRLPENVH